MLQSMQNAQHQQIYALRDLDNRLARLEDNRQPQTIVTSTDRATWWALWGLLMLVLGAALAVIILMILLQFQLR
jgi:hypothetical protein